jgi:hypothetical protein
LKSNDLEVLMKVKSSPRHSPASASRNSTIDPSRRRTEVLLAPLAVVVLCCLCGFLSENFARIAVQVAVTVLVLSLTWRRLSPVWESPVLIFGLFASANGILGYLFSEQLSSYGGTGGANTSLSVEQKLDTANLFLLSAVTVLLVGALIVGKVHPGQRVVDAIVLGRRPGIQRLAVLFATATFALVVMVRGPEWLVSRQDRFDTEAGALLSFVSLLTLVSVVLLGVSVTGKSRLARIWSVLLVGLFAVIYFSLGSRTLVLLPFLFLAGSLLAGSVKHVGRRLLIAGLFGALFAPLPLFLRAQSSHGVIPYLSALPNLTWSNDVWLAASNNVLNGFGIVGTTAFRRDSISQEHLLISLSPLTGSAAGWGEVSQQLRLNFYTPYAALGELGNQGWLFFAIACVCLGLALGFVQRSSWQLADHPTLGVLRFVPLGLSYLFVLQMTQYNLRSEMRLIWYSLFIAVALLVWRGLETARVGPMDASSESSQQESTLGAPNQKN